MYPSNVTLWLLVDYYQQCMVMVPRDAPLQEDKQTAPAAEAGNQDMDTQSGAEKMPDATEKLSLPAKDADKENEAV